MVWPKGKKRPFETREKISKANKGRKLSLETRKKMSERMKRRWQSSKFREEMSRILSGKKRTLEQRKRISKGVKKIMSSPEMREKCSLSRILAIKEGRANPGRNGVKGYFYSEKNGKKLCYRSLLERDWYQLLEQMSKVKRYSVEPIAIPYFWEGSIHTYLPDLRIRYIDGTTELVEIKPESRWDDPKNLAKWRAAKKWCESRRIPTVFKVVGYNGLG